MNYGLDIKFGHGLSIRNGLQTWHKIILLTVDYTRYKIWLWTGFYKIWTVNWVYIQTKYNYGTGHRNSSITHTYHASLRSWQFLLVGKAGPK